MEKFVFNSLVMTFLFISGEITSKEYGGGKIQLFGGGGGYDSVTLGGNSSEVFDKDNPDMLMSLLETKTEKKSRELRRSLKENLNHIYKEVVPEYEQSVWVKNRDKITDYGTYGSYSWVPKNDKDHVLEITYEEISFNKYKNIKELIEIYTRELKENGKYKYSINVLHQTPNSVVFEIERMERGVSDTLKKNTQLKSIEKWLIDNAWVLNLSYSLNTKGDKEQNDLWDQLKNTWEKRFDNVSFESE